MCDSKQDIEYHVTLSVLLCCCATGEGEFSNGNGKTADRR